MKYLMINKLKPECAILYAEAHRNCWSEMRQALVDAGAKNCVTFIRGNESYLFYECDDLDESFEKLGEIEANKKWQEMCAPWFDGTFELNLAELVFDLNS